MMNMLLSPLLAAAVAADQHAEVWAQKAAAPMQMAQAATALDSRARVMPVHHHGGPPPMGPPPGFGEPRPGPPFLRGLALTDAQEDRIFEILHAQAPMLRQRQRELHQAREELRALSRAERFDEARAGALADTSARAAAAIALIHARSEAAIWQVLTAEQRKQADETPPWPHHEPPTSHGGMRPPR
jgi:Spy/CpxP family protein refolding chaperone